MKLTNFRDIKFLPAIKAFFNELNVPMNYVADEPTTAKEILKDTYKDNKTFELVDEVYFVGMVDDAAFEGNKSLAIDKIKSDYDGILIFGITLHQRENNLLPTRSQLAEISRAFNREFYYTPVVLVFKYHDIKNEYIAFANTERLQYKQAWREGEKAGKVSLLRDIDIQRPHRGHEDIINQLRIQTSGTKTIDSFAKLYAYWQEVFSVSVLNKRFYQELSNWYFWAVKQVTFPTKPTEADAITKKAKLEDLIQEHNATNVIRLLTRLLFTWFIKEKKLIPEELFDLESLQKDILNEIAPYHENGLFSQANKDSVYYKAILQNLFFASLNCPINSDGTDTRERGFRGDGYGTHRGIDYLMRYKRYFKNPDAFLELMNNTVPFLNGGLFECLDDKYNNTYIDGFSDQMTKGEQLIVPDYLFFGVEEHIDLSIEYGISNSGTKNAAVKGLMNILKSYKFTITENTPIEEDVALDPELLGKVFENLLASYNPETKTTARKQTGSFYTPREIVNYMVDESLIAYLKNSVTDWGMEEKLVDEKLHQLASFDTKNPFFESTKLTHDIIFAIDRCKILDPACGSGAFPMGILQKMVHMLQKLDPNNLIWKEVQIQKVQEETSEVFKTIDDKAEREEKLKEINNAFDQQVNDPDYARKLYLIENCIYGVDIQPIATQISKLRFFISLVVDQKSNAKAVENFGIRPLPNLETKFVTANTLIGINKEANLFTTDTVKDLEKQLKHIRHKLFSARTKDTKLKYRQKDEELRKSIAEELKNQGLPVDSAEKLAKWDPYDQNASSPFFDPEWMFDLADGFDVVIGNPPYISYYSGQAAQISIETYNEYIKQYDFIENKKAKTRLGTVMMFLEKSHKITRKTGLFTFIIDLNIFSDAYIPIRKYLHNKLTFKEIINNLSEFENVGSGQIILRCSNHFDPNSRIDLFSDFSKKEKLSIPQSRLNIENNFKLKFSHYELILSQIEDQSDRFEDLAHIISGMNIGGVKEYFLSEEKKDNSYHKAILSGNIFKYFIKYPNEVQDRNKRNSFIKFDKKIEKFIWDNNLGTPSIGADENKFKQPKLLLRRPLTSDGSLAAAFSNDPDHYSDVTVYIINQKSKNLFFLLGIINSKLATFYSKQTGIIRADKGQQPQITINKFKEFPIRSAIINLEGAIIVLSKLLTYSAKQVDLFLSVLDALVFELYFPGHMKDREIDVLQFVERDIEKVLKGREFEELNDTEKEQVIEQLHQTWSHPDSEVRNRIKLFAVRSPEILKPILES